MVEEYTLLQQLGHSLQTTSLSLTELKEGTRRYIELYNRLIERVWSIETQLNQSQAEGSKKELLKQLESYQTILEKNRNYSPTPLTPTSRGLMSAGSGDLVARMDPADRPRDVVCGRVVTKNHSELLIKELLERIKKMEIEATGSSKVGGDSPYTL